MKEKELMRVRLTAKKLHIYIISLIHLLLLVLIQFLSKLLKNWISTSNNLECGVYTHHIDECCWEVKVKPGNKPCIRYYGENEEAVYQTEDYTI